MNELKVALSNYFIGRLADTYGPEVTAAFVNGDNENLDFPSVLNDLLNRVECEVSLAVDDLEYDINPVDSDE